MDVGLAVVVEAFVRAVGIAVFKFVVEALPGLVHNDRVLPVAHIEARMVLDAREDRRLRRPTDVVRANADHRTLAKRTVAVHGLVGRAPERRADRHRGEFARAVLRRIFFRGAGVFGSQARVEDAAEFDVPGVPSRRDDDRLPGVHRHGFVGTNDVSLREEARKQLSGHHRGRVVRAQTHHAAALFAEKFVHVVVEQEFDALFAGRIFEAAHQIGAARTGRTFGGLSFGPDAVMFATGADPDRVGAAVVGRLIDELHAVGEQEFERGRFVVRECVLHGAVVVAIVGHAARFDDRPVGEVLEERVGVVLDPVLLLEGRAAAQGDVAARRDGVTADVIVGVDHQNRKTRVPRTDRGRKPDGTRPDHDDVRFQIPLCGEFRRGSAARGQKSQTAQSGT